MIFPPLDETSPTSRPPGFHSIDQVFNDSWWRKWWIGRLVFPGAAVGVKMMSNGRSNHRDHGTARRSFSGCAKKTNGVHRSTSEVYGRASRAVREDDDLVMGARPASLAYASARPRRVPGAAYGKKPGSGNRDAVFNTVDHVKGAIGRVGNVHRPARMGDRSVFGDSPARSFTTSATCWARCLS